jgi:branched-chain amino acid aminotransferase
MLHRWVLHNESIVEASARSMSPGQVGLLAGWGVFSTIRVSRGVLFAFERHFQRMRRDAQLMRVPFPTDPEWMRSLLLKLVEANNAQDATLRVAVSRNKGGVWEGPGVARDFDLFGLTTALKDWGTGVRLSVVPQARHAANVFAGTKVLSWGQNLTWYEEAHDRGYDEVVLLNEHGEVSECTSANIFAVYGSKAVTPPLTSGCLPGVTRALLLEEVKVPGIDVVEQPLLPADLEQADEIFITSTTRDVLPVVEIEGLRIQRNGDATTRLLKAFHEHIDQYVEAQLTMTLS